jgi:hypothetical protein
MQRPTYIVSVLVCVLILCIAAGAFAQQQGQPAPAAQASTGGAPPLFLREDWKHVPDIAEHAVIQESVTTPNVELKLYGQTKQYTNPDRQSKLGDSGIYEVQGGGITYIYTGPCLTPCALALRDRTNYADLTKLAKVRWRTRQSGFHYLRPIIKLADGTWLVGDYAEPPSSDYRVTEFSFADVRWLLLNIDYVVTAKSTNWVAAPDLSKVDEIGFTDLMPGSPDNNGHGAASTSRVDWIEIYANKVPRNQPPKLTSGNQ